MGCMRHKAKQPMIAHLSLSECLPTNSMCLNGTPTPSPANDQGPRTSTSAHVPLRACVQSSSRPAAAGLAAAGAFDTPLGAGTGGSALLSGLLGGSSGGGGGLVRPYGLADLQADINRWPASYYSKQVCHGSLSRGDGKSKSIARWLRQHKAWFWILGVKFGTVPITPATAT
jgi:hypothetical protein